MDACIMRNYSNFVPRGHLRFEHAVLVLHEHKDDLFLNVMDKYLRYSSHVTVLVSCKIGKKGTFYHNNPYAQYFSSKLKETVQFIPTPRAYIERHYTAIFRPSILVTDSLESETYLPEFCPQYYNYASNRFSQLNISGCIEGLNLAHPIDLSRFDHQLYLFKYNYLRHKICIKTIIQILPPCFIFFTAFGDYKKYHRFQEVINSFILFKYKYDKYFGHEIMLILGGDYFATGSEECKYRRYLRSSLENLKKDHNVIFLKKTLDESEKKTLLRLSYAAFYLDDSPEFNDIKFAMSLGTPIICSNIGYAANMIVDGSSGFAVEPERIDHIAACMETLSIPTMYHRFSTAAREIYLKNYSETSLFMRTVSVREISNFKTSGLSTNGDVFCNLDENSDCDQSVNRFNIENDWYANNEYVVDNKQLSVFDDAAQTEYVKQIELCEKQVPQQKQFYENPSTEIYPGFTFDFVPLPKWSEEDEVADYLYSDDLFEMTLTGKPLIEDPSLNEQQANQIQATSYYANLNAGYQMVLQPLQTNQPPIIKSQETTYGKPFPSSFYEPYQPTSVEPYQLVDPYFPLPVKILQTPSNALYQHPLIESYQPSYFNLYDPRTVEPCQPPQVESYQPPSVVPYEPPPVEQYQLPFVEQYQLPSVEQYQLPSVEPNLPQRLQPYQPPSIESYEHSLVKSYQPSFFELFKPPSVEPCQPPQVESYQPPLIESYQPPRRNKPYKPSPIETYQPPPVESYQFLSMEAYQALLDQQQEPQITQPHPNAIIQQLEILQSHFNQSIQSGQSMLPHPNNVMQMQQPMHPFQNQSMRQFEPIQQHPDPAMTPQQTEAMQLYQPIQSQPNQSMQLHLKQLLQPLQAMKPKPNQIIQSYQSLLRQNQSLVPFQSLQTFPNQSIQSPQSLPNQRIQQPQILPNQSIQSPQILSNQPIQSPQSLPNQPIQPPQILPNQSIQSPQIFPNQQIQSIQPPQILANDPILPIQQSQVFQNQLIQQIQQSQVLSNQQIQSIQLPQVLPNQQIQSIQPPQVLSNQQIQSPQVLPNQQIQSPQVLPNQQSIPPYYVGIMQQYPPQVIQAFPVQNYPQPQFIAPNQPLWYQIAPVPSPQGEPQFSGSEYSTPRQYFEPEGVQIAEYEDREVNTAFEDPARHWEDVFAHDSLEEYSAHGSELSETREDAWSGICSDDTPSIGNRSWRVFNSPYRTHSQNSDDIWEEANQDSGDEFRGEGNGLQNHEGCETNSSLNMEKVTVEVNQANGCKECREEQIIKELHAKVDAKLENNQGIDTTFPKRSKSARRKAKKRRMKKARSEVSD